MLLSCHLFIFDSHLLWYQYKCNYFYNSMKKDFNLTLLYRSLFGKKRLYIMITNCLHWIVFKMRMEANDWKPLMVGVMQLWKLEVKAKLQHSIYFSGLILILQLWSKWVFLFLLYHCSRNEDSCSVVLLVKTILYLRRRNSRNKNCCLLFCSLQTHGATYTFFRC